LIDSAQAVVTKQVPVIIQDTIYKTEEVITPNTEGALQFVSDNIDNSIPALLILGLTVVAISIAVTFQILKMYVMPYIQSHYKIKRPYLVLYKIKIITWVLFIVFCFYQLVTSHIVIGISVSAFIAVIGFNFWKDFFAGIFLKLEGRLQVNDYIDIDKTKGQITKLHTRNLEINTQHDEVISIPYHRLLNTFVAKRLNKGEERSRSIKISIPSDSKNNSIKAIEDALNICPWIYTHKPSSVNRTSSTDYSITIYAADNFTFQKVEEFLKQHLINDSND
jgi:small-conductance mechanosensitive channel